MIYKMVKGARLPVSAQVAGEECQRLASEGRLTPRDVVDASRPEDAPLHSCFEWDDSKAAEKWREAQASYIIRSVVVNVTESTEPTRAFVAVVSDDSHKYQTVGYVLKHKDEREFLLESAQRDLVAFRRKYQTLHELSGLFEAIDEALGSQTRMELVG